MFVPPKSTAWEPGQQAELARRANISRQYLNDILRARKRATPERAAEIEAAAQEMGLTITRLDLLYPQESTNPLIG